MHVLPGISRWTRTFRVYSFSKNFLSSSLIHKWHTVRKHETSFSEDSNCDISKTMPVKFCHKVMLICNNNLDFFIIPYMWQVKSFFILFSLNVKAELKSVDDLFFGIKKRNRSQAVPNTQVLFLHGWAPWTEQSKFGSKQLAAAAVACMA